MTWPDPETITSLIEAHGTDPGSVLRPEFDGQAGWPVLLPIGHLDRLRRLAAGRMPDELIDDLAAVRRDRPRTSTWAIPVRSTRSRPRGPTLPPYRGPSEPASGHAHEWGESSADEGVGPADRDRPSRPIGCSRATAAGRPQPVEGDHGDRQAEHDQADPGELPDRRVLAQQDHRQDDGRDRLDQQEQRGDHAGQAWQRDVDQQVARHLRAQGEHDQPGVRRAGSGTGSKSPTMIPPTAAAMAVASVAQKSGPASRRMSVWPRRITIR